MKREYIYWVVIVVIALWAFTSSSNVSKEKEENEILQLELDKLAETIQDMAFALTEGRILEEIARVEDSVKDARIDSLILISDKRHDPINDAVPEHNARNDSLIKWANRFTRTNP